MQLLKKIGFYVFIVASIGAAIWGYVRLKENKEPKASVLEHITNSAQAVIETKTLSELISQLTRQNLIWNSLKDDVDIANAQNYIQYLDSVCKTNADISEILADNSVYLSFIKESNSLQFLLLFKVKEKNNEAVFLDFFVKHFKKSNLSSSIDSYEFSIKNQKWFATYKEGIVFVSSSVAVLEKSLKLSMNESMAANEGYLALLKENGTQKTQLFINKNLPKLFPQFIAPYQSLYTADVKLNEITFTGSLNTDSTFEYLKNQQAIEFDLYENLPQNPSCLIGVSVTSPLSFYEACKAIKDKSSLWKSINDSALYDMKQDFLENINSQIVLSNYEIENTSNGLLSFKINDKEKAKQFIALIKDSSYQQPELVYYHIKKKFKYLFSVIDPFQDYNYVSVSDNELVFMSDAKMVSLYHYSIINSLVLAKDAYFMGYAHDNLKQDCNLFCYQNSSIKNNYKNDFLFDTKHSIKNEKAISHISYTLKHHKNRMQMRLHISHALQKTTDSNTTSSLWSFDADSNIVTKVNVFTNHLTQENELCFQDKEKQLYLISSTGNLIWKKKLNETIQSDIYTVDIFKNGKYQLLFNTENYLHLLDRNGNYVQGYPVRLPSKATSSMTLLDYDKNKDYRIFIACADKRIYNFSLYGVKTEGYIPLKTDALVELPIYYSKIGQSDYLTTIDVMGKIYVFSRKGEGRIDFKNKAITGLSNFYVLAGNSLDNSKIIYVDDKNNVLNKISLTDKKELLKLGDELHGFKVNFDLLNDDPQTDILVYGDGAFYGYDLFSSKLMEYFSNTSVYDNVQPIATSSHNYVFAFDKIGQKIDVITKEGKLGFTIPNASKQALVSNLYKDGKTYVIMTNHHKVLCQELD